MDTEIARQFWVRTPGTGEIVAAPLAPQQEGEVLVRALYSGIRSDVSGIAGLALYLQRAERIPADETVVVVNTGCLDLSSY